MPKLKMIQPGSQPKSYSIKITRQAISIGRKETNDITLTDPSISSEHSNIKRVSGGYLLHDLNSTNGCKIKGERIDKLELQTDTSFNLGDVLVEFTLTEEELEILSQEEPLITEADKDSDKQEDENNKTTEDSEKPENLPELDDEANGSKSFLITVIAFLVTIVLAMAIILYLS